MHNNLFPWLIRFLFSKCKNFYFNSNFNTAFGTFLSALHCVVFRRTTITIR